MDPDLNAIDFKNKKNQPRILNIILGVGFICLIFYHYLFAPLGNKDVIIHISPSKPVQSVISELKEKNAIRYNFTLNVFVKLLKSGKGIVSGDYLIKKNSPVWVVAWQISRGYHNIEPVKVTLREGLTNEEMASIFADKIASFRKDLFLSETKDKQGYLFPDTYFFFPLDTTEEIIGKLSSNFENRINGIKTDINKSGKSLEKIIIMASILEGEANGNLDASMISGILWKRIDLGMPLQVDVYKQTYKEKGLPKSPINNPGLISIKAAIKPEKSNYLYYLHDKTGQVHYAVNFEEHKKNINKYLK